uniref:Uncharacterized protein n=1 Tax=Cacopsylla melanoneura TaxID=428564 RepID=A0A8D8SKA9_9HEMI
MKIARRWRVSHTLLRQNLLRGQHSSSACFAVRRLVIGMLSTVIVRTLIGASAIHVDCCSRLRMRTQCTALTFTRWATNRRQPMFRSFSLTWNPTDSCLRTFP